ncbi:DUF6396 domain-containing protein [Providencia vermicola]
MLECASKQGNGEAAYSLAFYLHTVERDFNGALKNYQISIQNGYWMGASILSQSFDPSTTQKDYYYLAVKPDSDRSARYAAIVKEIDASDETAKFPDIDKIVPLPLLNSLSGMGPLNIKNRLKDNNHDLFLFIL